MKNSNNSKVSKVIALVLYLVALVFIYNLVIDIRGGNIGGVIKNLCLALFALGLSYYYYRVRKNKISKNSKNGKKSSKKNKKKKSKKR